MLPRAHRLRVTQGHRLPSRPRRQYIGDQTVGGKITTAQHIACSRRGNRSTVRGITLRGKIGRRKGLCDQFAASLAAAVRIMTAQGLIFPIGPGPLLIGVNLIGGHQHARPDTAHLASGFQHVQGAHHIAGIGTNRIAVALSHQWLCSQVKNDFRAHLDNQRQQRGQITQIANTAVDTVADPGQLEQARRRTGRQSKACHLGTPTAQPECQPPALEAGMTGQEHTFASPELRI